MKKVLDYKIETHIGAGSFSEVYQARKDNQLYAVKLMRPPQNTSAEDVIQSLRYEFWVLKDLNHPNIIRLHDFGSLPDGRVFLVEEFLQGCDLKTFCQQHTFTECESVFLQIFQGLKAIHAWKIIHGDLKSENIFVIQKEEGTWQAKILDFGLSRSSELKNKTEQKITGTPATLAPECFLGEPPSATSDFYSLGVTLYESLTGHNPYLAQNLDQTIQNHLKLNPEPVAYQRNDVSPQWNQIIQKLLSKTPQERPSSATEILERIQKNKFILTPSVFIGRQKELQCYHELISLFQEKGQVALCVQGETGVGVQRFLKEVFHKILNWDSRLRDQIGFKEDTKKKKAKIWLLDRSPPEKSCPVVSILLKPFTKEECQQWFQKLFDLKTIPETFLEQMYHLTTGKPRLIWQLLQKLDRQGKLADTNGMVTTSSLELVPWQDFLNTSDKNKAAHETFETLLTSLRQHVKKRKTLKNSSLLEKLEANIEATKNAQEKMLKRAQVLFFKGANHIDQDKLSEARENLKTSLEILKDHPDYQVQALQAQNYLAYIHLRQKKIEDAIQLYEKVEKEKKKLPPTDQIQITNTDLGLAYLQAGEFQNAISQLEKELRQHQSDNNTKRQMGSRYNLAQAYAGLKQNNKAQNQYELALELARQNHDPAYLLRIYNGLGNLLKQQERWSEAIKAYDKAAEIALALGDKISAMVAIQNRGCLKGEHGLYEDAIKDLEHSLHLTQSLDQKFGFEKTIQCRALIELGNVYLKRHIPDKAKDYYDRAWHMAEHDEELTSFRFWVLLALVRYWQNAGDIEKCKNELSQLGYYAKDENQKSLVRQIRQECENPNQPSLSAEQIQLENEIEAILKINRDLVGEMSLDELLKKILGHAIDLTKSELGVILLTDQKARLKPALSLNVELDNDLTEISLSTAEKVLKTGRVVKSADAGQDADFNQYASVMALNLKSIIGVPITFQSKVLGVLYLSHRYQAALFDDKVTRLLMTFADQAGLALKNHQLLDFYKKASKELKEELEATQLSLTRAQERLKSGSVVFSENIDGHSFLTRSDRMLEITSQMERVASTRLTIVIHGESGTGKEVLARYIHDRSGRRDKPFIAINCGALPEHLVESELFGYKRGAFTGAERDKAGLIEAANGGTLFLDEITDLPLKTQVKLLRVLQEKEVVRVGENLPRAVDIRVLAASYKSLKDAVRKKTFREDLYFRLAGMEITLPSLRERKADISLLSEKFLQDILNEQKKKYPERISKQLMKLMLEYPWPGNIRELKNFIEVGVTLCDGKTLRQSDLPAYIVDQLLITGSLEKSDGGKSDGGTTTGWYDPRKTWKEHELLIYASALLHFDFDVTKTANSLGVGVATIYKWMRKHKIKDLEHEWKNQTLPYQEGLRLEKIQKFVFEQAAKRNPGHPYQAAQELAVAPATFYRWVRDE